MQNSQSLSTSLPLAHRRRPPGLDEQSVIQAHIDSNTIIITSMTKEIENRQKKASASALAYSEMLTQTRLLSEAAISFRNALSAVYATMSITRDDFFREAKGSSDGPIIQEFTEHCHTTLGSIIVEVGHVDAVRTIVIDKLHAAVKERDMAAMSATAITAFVSQLAEANNDARQELEQRNLWGLPTELWSQIFEDVQLPDRGSPSSASTMPRGWSHGSRALLLTRICRAWRSVAIGTKKLWSTINISPAKQSTLTMSYIVKLHLSRMGSLCPSLIIVCSGRVMSDIRREKISPVFAQIKSLRQLHLCLPKSAMVKQPDLLYNMLPTPEDIILEGLDTKEAPYVIMELLRRTPRTLTLIGCDIDEERMIPLASLTIKIGCGDVSSFEDWTKGPINTLERAVLNYKNSGTSSLDVRHIAGSLKYLETTVSLLCNHILPTQNMPSLRDLVITDAEYEARTWEDVAKQLGRETKLERVALDPMDEVDIQRLVGGLDGLLSLTTLELRGKGVEGGMEKLKEKLMAQKSWSQSLHTVVLVDYIGEGKEILDFLTAVEGQGERDIRIETINCPNLSLDLRRYLFERRGA